MDCQQRWETVKIGSILNVVNCNSNTTQRKRVIKKKGIFCIVTDLYYKQRLKIFYDSNFTVEDDAPNPFTETPDYCMD